MIIVYMTISIPLFGVGLRVRSEREETSDRTSIRDPTVKFINEQYSTDVIDLFIYLFIVKFNCFT